MYPDASDGRRLEVGVASGLHHSSFPANAPVETARPVDASPAECNDPSVPSTDIYVSLGYSSVWYAAIGGAVLGWRGIGSRFETAYLDWRASPLYENVYLLVDAGLNVTGLVRLLLTLPSTTAAGAALRPIIVAGIVVCFLLLASDALRLLTPQRVKRSGLAAVAHLAAIVYFLCVAFSPVGAKRGLFATMAALRVESMPMALGAWLLWRVMQGLPPPWFWLDSAFWLAAVSVHGLAMSPHWFWEGQHDRVLRQQGIATYDQSPGWLVLLLIYAMAVVAVLLTDIRQRTKFQKDLVLRRSLATQLPSTNASTAEDSGSSGAVQEGRSGQQASSNAQGTSWRSNEQSTVSGLDAVYASSTWPPDTSPFIPRSAPVQPAVYDFSEDMAALARLVGGFPEPEQTPRYKDLLYHSEFNHVIAQAKISVAPGYSTDQNQLQDLHDLVQDTVRSALASSPEPWQVVNHTTVSYPGCRRVVMHAMTMPKASAATCSCQARSSGADIAFAHHPTVGDYRLFGATASDGDVWSASFAEGLQQVLPPGTSALEAVMSLTPLMPAVLSAGGGSMASAPELVLALPAESIQSAKGCGPTGLRIVVSPPGSTVPLMDSTWPVAHLRELPVDSAGSMRLQLSAQLAAHGRDSQGLPLLAAPAERPLPLLLVSILTQHSPLRSDGQSTPASAQPLECLVATLPVLTPPDAATSAELGQLFAAVGAMYGGRCTAPVLASLNALIWDLARALTPAAASAWASALGKDGLHLYALSLRTLLRFLSTNGLPQCRRQVLLAVMQEGPPGLMAELAAWKDGEGFCPSGTDAAFAVPLAQLDEGRTWTAA